MEKDLDIPKFVNSAHEKESQQRFTSNNGPLSEKRRTPKTKTVREEKKKIKGFKKNIGRVALAALAAGIMATTPMTVSHIAQEVTNIEILYNANKNRNDYDENNLTKGSYEKLKQECDYYDRISNSDAINTVTQEEALQKVDTLRNLYFEIIKSKIAYAYGISPEQAGQITYKVWEPEKIGEEEIRINMPGHESLVDKEIPLSLQIMIRNTTNIDVNEYQDKSASDIITHMTDYAGLLNKFAKNNNYELDKEGNFKEVETEKEK